jgi:DNA-binding transcriptional LysR family regulator
MARRYGIVPTELLRTLVAAHDLGSFAKVASELSVTPAAISVQIKKLERLLGIELFVTSARGIKLSERGMMVEQYARRILALNDQILSYSGQDKGERTIRLGLQSVFAPTLMSRVIDNCEAAYPQGAIKIDCDNSPGLLNALASGHFEAVFALVPSEFRLQSFAEWTEQLVWVCASSFKLPAGSTLPLIMRTSGYIDSLTVQALTNKDIPYRIAYRANDLTTRTAIAAAGKGIMVLPRRVVPTHLVVAPHDFLPKLAALRAGIFLSEAIDVSRVKSVMAAFASAVSPPGILQRESVTELRAVPMSQRRTVK